jgi:hypothetical protein
MALADHLGELGVAADELVPAASADRQPPLRRWHSWSRWVTLAMLAHAFLVVAAVTERSCRPPPSGLIPLTCNEIQHLFAALVTRPAGDLGHGCAGQHGGADVRLGLVPAITAGKPPDNPEDQSYRWSAIQPRTFYGGLAAVPGSPLLGQADRQSASGLR